MCGATTVVIHDEENVRREIARIYGSFKGSLSRFFNDMAEFWMGLPDEKKQDIKTQNDPKYCGEKHLLRKKPVVD